MRDSGWRVRRVVVAFEGSGVSCEGNSEWLLRDSGLVFEGDRGGLGGVQWVACGWDSGWLGGASGF